MTLTFAALVKIQFLADWSGCTVETCLTNMYRVRNGLNTLFYLITIICFLITGE